jgi:cytochrome P450
MGWIPQRAPPCKPALARSFGQRRSDAYFRQDAASSSSAGEMRHVRYPVPSGSLPRGHRPPSGPCPLPDAPMGIVESYLAARRNLLEIIPRRALHQPVISGHTGPQRWHMLMDPPAIRRVMLEAVEDYPKSVATRAVLQPAIGDSLFLAEGDHWRWQRRATAPAFSARSIDALTPVMTRAAEAAAERLAMSVGRAANMVEHMTAATFDVIADVTFSEDQGVDRAGRDRRAGALYRRRRADEHSRRSRRSGLDPETRPRLAGAAIATDARRDRRRHRAAQRPRLRGDARPPRPACWRPRMPKPGGGWTRPRCARTC